MISDSNSNSGASESSKYSSIICKEVFDEGYQPSNEGKYI